MTDQHGSGIISGPCGRRIVDRQQHHPETAIWAFDEIVALGSAAQIHLGFFGFDIILNIIDGIAEFIQHACIGQKILMLFKGKNCHIFFKFIFIHKNAAFFLKITSTALIRRTDPFTFIRSKCCTSDIRWWPNQSTGLVRATTGIRTINTVIEISIGAPLIVKF